MINVHRLARIWRYLLIASSTGLVLTFLLPPITGKTSDAPSIWIWGAIIVGGLSGAITYGMVTSRIITSPGGIESVSFGIRVKASWEQVENIDINPFGFVNLVFKESLYQSKLLNALLRPLAYDRIFQLSPYMDDLATSTLLQDLAKYVPTSNILEFIAKQKQNPQPKPHQKVGTIGLYYFGWFMALVPISFVLEKAAEQSGIWGLPNLTLISHLISFSLVIGLLIGGMGLLGYNAEIEGLPEKQIARKARVHYLNPFVVILSSFIVSLSIWWFLQARSIMLTNDRLGSYALLAFIIGGCSLRASSRVEKLVFPNELQQG